MTNYATGHLAEKRACDYLSQNGYKIIDTNWKTKYCEIDIVAKKKSKIYFIEVKYRLNDNQGSGFDYITDNKQSRMKFAAEMWVQQHGWNNDYGISAIELYGQNYEVRDFLPDIE